GSWWTSMGGAPPRFFEPAPAATSLFAGRENDLLLVSVSIHCIPCAGWTVPGAPDKARKCRQNNDLRQARQRGTRPAPDVSPSSVWAFSREHPAAHAAELALVPPNE